MVTDAQTNLKWTFAHEWLLYSQEVIRILYVRIWTIGLLHTKFHRVPIQDGYVPTGYIQAFVSNLFVS